jgi:hypothetical protein
MTISAIETDAVQPMEYARAEVLNALRIDYSDPDLLLKLFALDLRLGHQDEAGKAYNNFRRVNPNSPVIKLVEQNARQQAGDAVAGKP